MPNVTMDNVVVDPSSLVEAKKYPKKPNHISDKKIQAR